MAGRPYCEAFPFLDVHDVMRAAAGERTFLQWVDEDGLIVGHVARLEATRDSARFFYRFFGTRNLERGTGQFDVAIRYAAAGGAWNKPSFVFPQCGRSKVRLYYVRAAWLCNRLADRWREPRCRSC